MGCIMDLYIWVIMKSILYFVIYPIRFIIYLFRKTGLIWSAGFFLLTEFMFLDSVIQDYRFLIVFLLLFPAIFKLIRTIKNLIGRFKWWIMKRDMRKKGFDDEINITLNDDGSYNFGDLDEYNASKEQKYDSNYE